MKKVWLSWSSGKDSAYALYRLQRSESYQVTGLFTTVGPEGRVPIHEIPLPLLRSQARATGLPLHIAPLPWPCSNSQYEARLRDILGKAFRSGVEAIAFGDLFLNDIREYRVRLLESSGLEPLFPLWLEPTAELSRAIIQAGFRTRVVALDTRWLDPSFLSREYDVSFLEDLPSEVDPCGENGEFHTFVYSGPIMGETVRIRPCGTRRQDMAAWLDWATGGQTSATGR